MDFFHKSKAVVFLKIVIQCYPEIFHLHCFHVPDKTLVKVQIAATEAAGGDIIGTVTISTLSLLGVGVIASDFGMLVWQCKNIMMINLGFGR